MNLAQHTVTDIGSGSAVCLMITRGETNVAADPERLMEEMWVRATKIGPVLEKIIHEPHPEVCWELNE